MDQKITESHFPRQYLNIAFFPGNTYVDIALAAEQYKIIILPALAFDLPTQSVTYVYVAVYLFDVIMCTLDELIRVVRHLHFTVINN